jgi:hypothetical protein
MKPDKFKKICRKYFTDTNFTIETNIDEPHDVIAISVFYCGYCILRYYGKNRDYAKEKPSILLAEKFKYSEEHGRILPCRKDGTPIGIWLDYSKVENVGHNRLIKIILDMIEKIKIAKVNYKKHLIEKDFV